MQATSHAQHHACHAEMSTVHACHIQQDGLVLPPVKELLPPSTDGSNDGYGRSPGHGTDAGPLSDDALADVLEDHEVRS
jgi:hypothetical protein